MGLVSSCSASGTGIVCPATHPRRQPSLICHPFWHRICLWHPLLLSSLLLVLPWCIGTPDIILPISMMHLSIHLPWKVTCSLCPSTLQSDRSLPVCLTMGRQNVLHGWKYRERETLCHQKQSLKSSSWRLSEDQVVNWATRYSVITQFLFRGSAFSRQLQKYLSCRK